MAYDVKSVNTTLCYLRRGEDYLMLHRVKKQNDVNQDKWIGVGGKFEADESPEDCLLREVREETGLNLTRYQYRGIVTFVSERWVTEYMHLFTADGWTGEIGECSEGVLEWVPRSRLLELPHWEGDAIFLDRFERGENSIKKSRTGRRDVFPSDPLFRLTFPVPCATICFVSNKTVWRRSP